MTIVVVGLNHRTAPVELRERFLSCENTLPDGSPAYSLEQASGPVLESVVLSTCNRLEVYASVAGSAESGYAALESYLIGLQEIESPAEVIRPFLYAYEGPAAVE